MRHEILESTERRRRFDGMYREHYAAIYRYVFRRLQAGTGDAADVVAEVFAVAWRRIEDVPAAPEDRLWLFGVARRRLLRVQRSTERYVRLRSRLRERADLPQGDDSASVIAREAIAGLRASDREVLMLVHWEGLNHSEAATVMGCSVNAVALRVSRAKRRLLQELNAAGVVAELSDPQKARS